LSDWGFRMRINVNKKKCSGCRLCETICSLFHAGAVNTEKSAIRIEKDDLGTNLNTPFVCRQCKHMPCLEGEQIAPEEERKKFVWARQRSSKCPFRALNLFRGRSYHCDLCGGNPQCVKVCTTGALVMSRAKLAGVRLPEAYVEKREER
jgi:carbon-monoxide dehydrogenase iron sulfur subunit